MTADQMTTKALAEGERAFKIYFQSTVPTRQRRFTARFTAGVKARHVTVHARNGQANAVHRDAVAQFGAVDQRPKGNAEHAAVWRMLDGGDLTKVLNDAGEHGTM